MKYKQTELELFTVHEDAKQDREIRCRWQWVEPSVWTDHMLAALEQGVKGNKWFSLIDKVYSTRNLEASARKVIRNGGCAGIDNQTTEMFKARIGYYLNRLHDLLKKDSYQPKEIKRVFIPKPGSRGKKRPLGIPTVRDRVVQMALRNAIEPIFEKDFAEHSYGFRPGKDCKDALRRVKTLLEEGYTWVVDADIKSYFDSIPHDRLMSKIKEKLSDGKVLKLIEKYLNQKIIDTAGSWIPEEGTPQGAIISPLLSNIYLDPLDKLMAEKGYKMTRYADDFVVQCRTEREASRALKLIKRWMEEAALKLNDDKTKTVDAVLPGGFDFLGYHFERGMTWPSRKSEKRLRDIIRPKTRRTNGNSMEYIIKEINRTLVGWFEYYKHGSNAFSHISLDGWVRMRLRSVLRKRHGSRGCSGRLDNKRWPNSYFTELGLFSLRSARISVCQSLRR